MGSTTILLPSGNQRVQLDDDLDSSFIKIQSEQPEQRDISGKMEAYPSEIEMECPLEFEFLLNESDKKIIENKAKAYFLNEIDQISFKNNVKNLIQLKIETNAEKACKQIYLSAAMDQIKKAAGKILPKIENDFIKIASELVNNDLSYSEAIRRAKPISQLNSIVQQEKKAYQAKFGYQFNQDIYHSFEQKAKETVMNRSNWENGMNNWVYDIEKAKEFIEKKYSLLGLLETEMTRIEESQQSCSIFMSSIKTSEKLKALVEQHSVIKNVKTLEELKQNAKALLKNEKLTQSRHILDRFSLFGSTVKKDLTRFVQDEFSYRRQK